MFLAIILDYFQEQFNLTKIIALLWQTNFLCWDTYKCARSETQNILQKLFLVLQKRPNEFIYGWLKFKLYFPSFHLIHGYRNDLLCFSSFFLSLIQELREILTLQERYQKLRAIQIILGWPWCAEVAKKTCTQLFSSSSTVRLARTDCGVWWKIEGEVERGSISRGGVDVCFAEVFFLVGCWWCQALIFRLL